MKQCIIVGAGTIYQGDLPFEKQENDLLIAADGGYEYLVKAGMSPDLLIGDFDSMEKPKVSCETITLPVEKDDTDIVFAVKEGFRRGYTRFVIFGGLGGKRLSHTIANMQLLEYVALQGGTARLIGGTFSLFLLTQGQSHSFEQEIGKELSVFSITPAASVTLQGVKYPVTKATLERCFPLGVSNRILEPTATVMVRSGTILVVIEGKA